MALLLLALLAIMLGFCVIALARGATPTSSVEQETSRPTDEDLARIERMDVDRLEEIIGRLVERMGMKILDTEFVEDDAVDILAEDPRPLIGAQWIFHAVAVPGGVVDTPQVLALGDAVRAARAAKGIFVTNGFFTDDAVSSAGDQPLELVNRDRFRDLLAEHRLLAALGFDQPPA